MRRLRRQRTRNLSVFKKQHSIVHLKWQISCYAYFTIAKVNQWESWVAHRCPESYPVPPCLPLSPFLIFLVFCKCYQVLGEWYLQNRRLHCWETLKRDRVLATEAGCKERFYAWEILRSRDSSRALIMVPQMAIGPGSNRHQGQHLRQRSGAWAHSSGPSRLG